MFYRQDLQYAKQMLDICCVNEAWTSYLNE